MLHSIFMNKSTIAFHLHLFKDREAILMSENAHGSTKVYSWSFEAPKWNYLQLRILKQKKWLNKENFV